MSSQDRNDQHPQWQLKAMRKASRWAQIFAVIGLVLAGIASILASLNDTIPDALAAFVLPAHFIYALVEWRGDFGPAVLLALAVNAAGWAGIGWLFGYGASR